MNITLQDLASQVNPGDKPTEISKHTVVRFESGQRVFSVFFNNEGELTVRLTGGDIGRVNIQPQSANSFIIS